jgi:DNA-directed RNA polymerase subunit beta'
VIVEEDCKTDNVLDMRAIVQGGAMIASLGERILGRPRPRTWSIPRPGNVIAKQGELIDEAAAT